MKIHRAFIVLLLAVASAAAWAQWQWLDKDGRRVFSDRAPPPEIPDKSILKRPAGAKPALDIQTASPQEAVAPAPLVAASGPKGGGLDKELEAKRKQAAEAEAAKRKAEEERIAKLKVENCARAKQAKTALESGVRMAQVNASGEREFMDEAARAAEMKRIQSVIAVDCK